MAELVDALDLGSSGVIHGGSSPFTRTNEKYILYRCFFLITNWKKLPIIIEIYIQIEL